MFPELAVSRKNSFENNHQYSVTLLSFDTKTSNLYQMFHRYTNAYLKICQYLRLHMKICRRFHVKTFFTLWDKHTWEMWKVYLQTFRKNLIRKKLASFLINLQFLRANNSEILSEIFRYLWTNILGHLLKIQEFEECMICNS